MKILAVVAHSDDEVLGCGGTLRRHADAGDEVFVLCLCNRGLYRELAQSCRELGAQLLGDGRLVHVQDQRFDLAALTGFVDLVAEWGQELQPDVVYLHNPHDLNLDHEIAARATLTAFRPAGRPSPTLLAFEALSSTEWSPAPFVADWFVELTPLQLNAKVAALGMYPTEVRESPHPRNPAMVVDQARLRGSHAGVQLAEAFRLYRHTCSTEQDQPVDRLSRHG